MKITVYNAAKKQSAEKEFKTAVFDDKAREGLIHEVVRAVRAGRRQGTSSTLTRSEVRGGGKKPWRQKGTGRARAGTLRSPLMKGGGVIFGPKPRDFSVKIPAKARRAALRSALSWKAQNKQLLILEAEFAEPKTKIAREMLDSMKIDVKTTVVVMREEANAAKSFRNLDGVNVAFADSLNVYDVLDNKAVVCTQKSFDHICEVLAKC